MDLPIENQTNSLPIVAMMDFISDVEIEQKILDGVARVVPFMLTKKSDFPQEISRAQGILAWHLLDYNKNVLEKLSDAKIIVRVGMGVDSVDLIEAGKRSIYVANVPDYGVEEVADSAMCMLLNLLRKTVSSSLHQNNMWDTTKAFGATRIRGLTLGIVGFGKIGKAFALRAKPFGLEVIFYDPYLEDGIEKSLGVIRKSSLKELIECADIISIHCSLNESNHHMINRESLSWIKTSGCYLINTARGGLIDELALVETIKGGQLKGVALDVFENEPYETSSALLSDDLAQYNILLTPHSAFYSDQGMIEMRSKAALEIKRVLLGSKPRNCVNMDYFQPIKT